MTLVEVMAAFFVLILVICGALLTLQSGYKSLDTARCSTLAAQIMQSQIETIRLMNWSALSTAKGAKTLSATELKALLPANAASMSDRFTLTQDIRDDPDHSENMILITLTVTWSGQGGLSHSRSFVTRYGNNGLYDYYYTYRS
jgi:hypothetical protein